MAIVGVDEVVLGVEDIAESVRFCRMFGLKEAAPGVFRCEDGSGVVLKAHDDPSLPVSKVSGSDARETIWGVSEAADLDRIERALDGQTATRTPEGMLRARDGDGRAIAFRLTRRTPYVGTAASANCYGAPPQRPVNSRVAMEPILLRTIGHAVYFSADPQRSADFYVRCLDFTVSDSYEGSDGVFLRARGSHDHHNVFFIGEPTLSPRMNHIEFHVRDVDEVLRGGQAMMTGGWSTFMGPGRHIVGSNVYWYLESPGGVLFEYSCDIDYADDGWQPRVWTVQTGGDVWNLAKGSRATAPW
jgi:catechol 2,3-dioxygenase-like lactoylglutathione lyase family enzyme